MSVPTRLDHCVIHVSDWERSTAFYRDVLGAEPVPVGIGFAYRFGDVQLNSDGPDQIGQPVARIPVAPGNSDLRFAWAGTIEEARAHLDRCGVPVELGPVKRRRAGRGHEPLFPRSVERTGLCVVHQGGGGRGRRPDRLAPMP